MDAKRDNIVPRPNRTRIIIGVERTVMGSSHGNKTDVNPILELTKVDHHFVPTLAGSDEDLRITYRIRGYDNEEVKLRISNPTHNPTVIYERALTTEERRTGNNKIIRWNGATNCISGPLKGKLINPMFAAYKVELVHRRKTTPALETHVIYRELKLERMNWKDAFYAVTKLPAAKFPVGGSRAEKYIWLQYKLNELGYYAGPVLPVPNMYALFRALFRYTQEHPAFPTIYDFKTLDAGEAGKCKWGWAAEWYKVFGTITQISQIPLNPNVANLIRCLENNERPYDEVLETKEVFDPERKNSRLFVDHNIFSQNKDFAGEDAHASYDAEFCNRALMPIRAKALLLSRTDSDASKPGIDSPEAVGEFECEWRIFDPPEDILAVPTAARGKVRLVTKARAYLDTIHHKVDGNYGDTLDAQDNCPLEYGGFRLQSSTDVKDFFIPLEPSFPARLENGSRFFSKANWDSAAPPGILGTNCATFQGSYIAGDNYVIQARLAFEKHPNARALLMIHYSIEKLKPSLKLKGIIKPGEPERSLIAQSGRLTIWRRTGVAHVLDWGPSNYPPIEWDKITAIFRAAHIELIQPKQAPERLDAILDASARTEVADAIVQDALAGKLNEPNKTEFTTRQSQKVFNPDGFHPIPFRKLVEFENSTLFTDDKQGSSKSARFNRYAKYLANLIDAYPTFDYMKGAALALRKAYDRLRSTSGIIILRTAYLPKPNWDVLLPADVAAATRAEQSAFNPYRGVSTGMDYGVVILDSGQYLRLSDEFFYSHEIAHCLFGSHAFEAPSLKDHDSNDRNCIMYYGTATKGNGGETSGWGLRVKPAPEYTLLLDFEAHEIDPNWNELKAEPGFDGKYVSGVARYGDVSGKFKKNKGDRFWSLTGSIESLQKAVTDLKFKPSVAFNDKTKTRPPNLFVAITLRGDIMIPKTSKGPLPIGWKAQDRAGSAKPFADVRLEPFDVRDNEPRFCGKCLLKLRGWKIRTINDPGVGTPPDPPTNPRMEFIKYRLEEGAYLAQIGVKQDIVTMGIGKTDPQDPTLKLGPMRFLHEHRLSWESTDGKMSSLKGVLTREWVKFRTPTQDPPFSVAADPDQEFYMGEADASIGEGIDDHSVRWAALICQFPLTEGSLIGEQWYQYKMPGEDWLEVPGSAFLLEKTVKQQGSNWVLIFKKTNWEEYNPTPYYFEVRYLIGRQPLSQPIPIPVKYDWAPTSTNPIYTSKGGSILAAGTHEIFVSYPPNSKRDTDPQELERLGYLAPKPWT
jgi:hypothetical protein